VVVTGPTDTKLLDDAPSLDEVRAAVAALE
jgi:hypothetical protein